MTSEKTLKPLYHDFEIAICGFSGSGKTTLLEKLFQYFSKDYSVGFVKSDAHKFQMDKDGKDTKRMWNAGAASTHIFDLHHWSYIAREKISSDLALSIFQKNDFVLVEGRKESSIPKVVLLDEEKSILSKIEKGEITNIKAFVGPWEYCRELPQSIPYFQRDKSEEIAGFILNYFAKKIKDRPLFGLVLTGGASSRMNKDKALLKYGNMSQMERACDLLKPYCEKVFISARPKQRDGISFDKNDLIEDCFINFGPLGGILSAFKAEPNASFLVLAIDLPYLDSESIENLLQKRNPFKVATAYASVYNGLPEPLCAIYEARSYAQLLHYLSVGIHCPRKILCNSSVHLLDAIHEKALENINYPEEYEQVLKDLNL